MQTACDVADGCVAGVQAEQVGQGVGGAVGRISAVPRWARLAGSVVMSPLSGPW